MVALHTGRVITVTAELEGYVGMGSAIRDPRDTPSRKTGRLLATGRALDDLAHKLKRAGWSRVSREGEQTGADPSPAEVGGTGDGPPAASLAYVQHTPDHPRVDEACLRTVMAHDLDGLNESLPHYHGGYGSTGDDTVRIVEVE